MWKKTRVPESLFEKIKNKIKTIKNRDGIYGAGLGKMTARL